MRRKTHLVPVRPGGFSLGKYWFTFSSHPRTWGKFQPPQGSLWKGGVDLGPFAVRWD